MAKGTKADPIIKEAIESANRLLRDPTITGDKEFENKLKTTANGDELSRIALALLTNKRC